MKFGYLKYAVTEVIMNNKQLYVPYSLDVRVI